MPLFTQPPKSLCILRLSAIGDTCHVLAAVQQIQRHWQQTRITWIIGKTEAALFRHVKGIHFVIYDKKSGWKGVLALWKQLKDCHFDALLNMQTAFRASLLSLGIKANYKIGFGKQRAREGQWLFTNRRIEDPATPHVLDGFLAFVAYLGVPVSPPTWDLGITDEMRRQVAPYLDPNRRNLLISLAPAKRKKIGCHNVMRRLQITPINAICTLFYVVHRQRAKWQWYKILWHIAILRQQIYAVKPHSWNFQH